MRARVLTALVAISLVLGAVFIPHPFPIVLLASVIAAVGANELVSLLRKQSGIYHVQSLFAATTVAFGDQVLIRSPLSEFYPAKELILLTGLLLFLVGVLAAAVQKGRSNIAVELLASFWVSGPLLALTGGVGSGGLTSIERWTLVVAFVPIWAGDITALFTGMKIGRRKLAPSISPKKTLEGAVGNLLASVCLAVALCELTFPERGVAPFPIIAALCIGLFGSLFGQAGDLFESWLKRRSGLKDSGSLLPGHGGILDRIDSLLFGVWPALLIVYFFISLIANEG